MDFALSDESRAIFDMAHDVGQAEIAPHAAAWERAGTIPRDLWPKLADLGLLGLYVSEEAGGTGLGRLDATLVFEALSMACPSVAAFLSIHNMCARMVDAHATPEARAAVLPKALRGETWLAYCLTEPGSGSDAAALRTRAVRSNEGWRLTGTKAFISGGGYADAYVVMARTGQEGARGVSAFLVEDGTEGLGFGALEEKMGWRAQPTRQVQLDDAPVPAAYLLGEEGRGFAYAMQGLDGGRLNIAACSLGAAQSALDRTVAYVRDRRAFGQPLAEFQNTQFRLAEMEIELQSARTFLRQAAWMLDQDDARASVFCAMAKKLVTEAGSRVVDGCLQLHGGYGYLADYGIEKLARDLRVHQILEGTNEIMRLIVARGMLAA